MRPEGEKLQAALLHAIPPEARVALDAALGAMLEQMRSPPE